VIPENGKRHEAKSMAYTVKQLAVMSGVTVRTLHCYDEMALLKPAYTKANGYRIYEEPQLLMLQQILFYRELGFELKRINEIEPATIRKNRRSQVAPPGSRKERRADPHAD
jgi:DNA-binding transcriptional MerR regulator